MAAEKAFVADALTPIEAPETDSSSRHAVQEPESASVPAQQVASQKLVKLPMSRVKALMKSDPDVSLASQESVFIICKATVRHWEVIVTELFIETIAKDAYIYAQRGKRKTLQRKDLDNAVDAIDEFAFLEGTLD
ncbi:DNA polymerase epsilon subunit 4 isoform X1 [Mixophyes fleayi]|uniref:DNA polymerase epsilon subunit 4 isoform X1 n=1 Tax=Mixophyes fleayi TaxID=3061075 RepID=UPI003F4E15C2